MPKPQTCGIYCITHIESGRRYVGQSVNIERRISRHRFDVSTRDHMLITRAIAAHGWPAFKWEVIERCAPEELNERERHWVRELGCLSPSGYNLTSGGGQLFSASEETRSRMSASAKLRGSSPQARARAVETRRSLFPGGKIEFSQEHRQNLSAAMTGKKKSEEHCRRIRESKADISNDTRALMAAAATGRQQSAETKAKRKATWSLKRLQTNSS